MINDNHEQFSGSQALITKFLDLISFEEGLSSKTLEAYGSDLESFSHWAHKAQIDLLEISNADIDTYIAQISQTLKRSSVARKIASLRRFYAFVETAFEKTNPTSHLRTFKIPENLPSELSVEQIAKLIRVAKIEDRFSIRNVAAIELLYGSGLRISELIGINWPDVDFERGFVKVMGKGSKERIVPMTLPAQAALMALLKASSKENVPNKTAFEQNAVFRSSRNQRISRQGMYITLKRLAKIAGIQGFHPHSLRHSCATHMLRNGADIRIIMELLGHSSINTTQIYTKLTKDDIFHVFQSKHPRACGEI